MACWPANATGAFFLALLIFDMVNKDWKNLPLHALIGVVFTAALWGLCILIGSTITGSILLIPLLAILFFMAGIWFTGASLRKQGCCVRCNGTENPESQDEGNQPQPPPQQPPSSTVKGETCVDLQLKATPLS